MMYITNDKFRAYKTEDNLIIYRSKSDVSPIILELREKYSDWNKIVTLINNALEVEVKLIKQEIISLRSSANLTRLNQNYCR